jgi:hypothetical protein
MNAVLYMNPIPQDAAWGGIIEYSDKNGKPGIQNIYFPFLPKIG